MFITFEGIDGSGKSTAINKLVEFLNSKNVDFLLTREPGAHIEETKVIRDLLLNPKFQIPKMTEALLYAADRRLNLERVIWPALKSGKVVLCDRFLDSSLAYQGYARDLGIEKIKLLQEIATDKTYPDLTIYFDIHPKAADERVAKRENEERDRLELEGDTFRDKVHKGYDEVVKMFPERIKVIDASLSPDKVYEQLLPLIVEALNL